MQKKEDLYAKAFFKPQENEMKMAKTSKSKDNKSTNLEKKQPVIKDNKPLVVKKKPLANDKAWAKGKKQPLAKGEKLLKVEKPSTNTKNTKLMEVEKTSPAIKHKKPLGIEKKEPILKNNKTLVIVKTLPFKKTEVSVVKKKHAPNKKKTFVVQKALKPSKRVFFEKNKSLFLDLLKIHAYYGDTEFRNHSSQNSFVYAYRNEHSLYNLHSSILNLKRALHFMRKQDPSKFVFVGSPMNAKEKMSLLFQKLKIPFFASSEWVPGFISKKDYDTSKILVIYDIYANHGAKNEAFKAGYPIVGFFSIHADVNGIDYPINLNVEACDLWYYNLWKSYFQSKKHVTRS